MLVAGRIETTTNQMYFAYLVVSIQVGTNTRLTQPPNCFCYLYITLNLSHTNGISSENSLSIFGSVREKKFLCALRQ